LPPTDEEQYTIDEEQYRRLQQNDPAKSYVRIWGLCNNSARQYGDALQNNTVVQEIIMQGSELTLDDDNDDVDLLLQFIETSQSLKVFGMLGVQNAGVVGRFLVALSKSSSIKELSLRHIVTPSESLENLLCGTQSLTKLEIDSSSFEGQFAAIESHNRSIEELELVAVDTEDSLIHVLEHFGAKSKMKRLSIGSTSQSSDTDMSSVLSKCIQQLLGACSNLQTVHFRDFKFQASTFGPIATEIKTSQSLQNLQIDTCKFDSGSTDLFRSIFQSPISTILLLDVQSSTTFHQEQLSTKQHEILPTILSEIIALKPNTSKLTEIKLDNFLSMILERVDLSTILRPLEEDSTLECLHICRIYHHGERKENFSSIPRL
jgi:hypothetical protein